MEKVVHKVAQFIDENALFTKTDKLLLTVSGGVDSMVMLHIFHQLGYDLAVAHCNFQLRGAESNEDENFVKARAAELNSPFHSTHFETATYAKAKGVTLPMVR